MDFASTTRILQINALMAGLRASGPGAVPADQALRLQRRIDAAEMASAAKASAPPAGARRVDVYA